MLKKRDEYKEKKLEVLKKFEAKQKHKKKMGLKKKHAEANDLKYMTESVQSYTEGSKFKKYADKTKRLPHSEIKIKKKDKTKLKLESLKLNQRKKNEKGKISNKYDVSELTPRIQKLGNNFTQNFNNPGSGEFKFEEESEITQEFIVEKKRKTNPHAKIRRTVKRLSQAWSQDGHRLRNSPPEMSKWEATESKFKGEFDVKEIVVNPYDPKMDQNELSSLPPFIQPDHQKFKGYLDFTLENQSKLKKPLIKVNSLNKFYYSKKSEYEEFEDMWITLRRNIVKEDKEKRDKIREERNLKEKQEIFKKIDNFQKHQPFHRKPSGYKINKKMSRTMSFISQKQKEMIKTSKKSFANYMMTRTDRNGVFKKKRKLKSIKNSRSAKKFRSTQELRSYHSLVRTLNNYKNSKEI